MDFVKQILCLTTVLTIVSKLAPVNSKKIIVPGKQDSGYFEVREGAHLFYWFFYTEAEVENYTERPLVIWLQGGPGAGATYFTVFNFLGPLDTEFNYRNETWIKYVNLIVVDSPVGAGYSYVKDASKYARSDKEIALDLVEFMKQFYQKHSEFENLPLYIFGESYGGKTALHFALELYRAQENGKVKCQVESVSLGNGWISTEDILAEVPATAYYMGIIDKKDIKTIEDLLKNVKAFIDKDFLDWASVYAYLVIPKVVCRVTQGVNIFNADMKINRKMSDDCLFSFVDNDAIEVFMNEEMRKNFEIPDFVHWESMPDLVLVNLRNEILESAFELANTILNSTNIHLNVFSGNYDLLVPTSSTLKWIERLDYPHKSSYEDAPRNSFFVNDILEGYEKIGKNLSMFWILHSGHMVAKDNLNALNYILKKVTHLED